LLLLVRVTLLLSTQPYGASAIYCRNTIKVEGNRMKPFFNLTDKSQAWARWLCTVGRKGYMQ
jgi:hypothetical protein